jgi:hypothetical protein
MDMFRTVASEGALLKREQLYHEIGRVADPVLRSNLEHTYSKLFMFLEEDIGRALRIAANTPYQRKQR